MHPAISRLVDIVPPAAPPRPRDWTTVEAALGTPLPDDFKQLVDVYGGGLFDETIWLLDPGCADPGYELLAIAAERDEILADLWDGGEPKPAELLDGEARVIPWAYVEGSGHYLYWLVRPGQHPDSWTVMLNEGRGPEWEHHQQTCAGFLAGVMTGDVESFYFDDLPGMDHTFVPNDEILTAT
ncbi:hypothetical protein BLA24_21200 [Streptomyces cinnamoneus]|uniref:SMI1/KNR4 family protein n=1 Tax=Streptomyces cinnamoneus TaxID=53446 RepID=A0A2G1XFU0_STRCJ|nr:SMI1/KNR4 family protein [Streptomyces cinnamoneus]PHQ50106.1 hypothetical protein BLA24_21200 [Streptomyces cinnamoneus]PPT13113.1 hypothetical protein CYQ11_09585 [Streptomyces cinnamoneus]